VIGVRPRRTLGNDLVDLRVATGGPRSRSDVFACTSAFDPTDNLGRDTSVMPCSAAFGI